jgi:GT2 family glycosyltransferase
MCLESLVGRVDCDHEIIVIDAGSADGTVEFLQGLDGIRLVCDGARIGQARSYNQVFKTIMVKYTCWLSDDNVVLNGMLDLAVSILEQHDDIGMVALKTRDVKGPYVGAPYIGGIWSTGILNCNQGVIRTKLLRDVGYFDEAFRDYGIDADLTAKVLLAGYKVVYTKDVAIHHYRDHEAAPGAIEKDQRALRLKAANELYNRKYAYLRQFSLAYRIACRLGGVIWFGIACLRRIVYTAGLHPESVFGFMRDWYNVLSCRYISKLDLWRNRRRPFYLVQSIDGQAYRK